MERKELYQAVKDRNAEIVFGTLEINLQMAHLNGANAHIGDLIQSINFLKTFYTAGIYPQEETMADFRKRDRNMFEKSMVKISKAVNEYHVKI
jgi:hypothetical protein